MLGEISARRRKGATALWRTWATAIGGFIVCLTSVGVWQLAQPIANAPLLARTGAEGTFRVQPGVGMNTDDLYKAPDWAGGWGAVPGQEQFVRNEEIDPRLADFLSLPARRMVPPGRCTRGRSQPGSIGSRAGPRFDAERAITVRTLLLILGLVFWSVQVCWAAVTAPELANKAVQALNSKCYEARMRYMSQFEGGEVSKVHIWHVAPDLYRVEPLMRKTIGEWDPSGVVYVEDARELVRFNPKTSKVEAMPERRFRSTIT